MKITVRQDENAAEIEITVTCPRMTAEIADILAQISLIGNTVTGTKDGETCFVPLSEILYFEAVEDRVFFYTDAAVYETVSRLYQLEEKLTDTPFARISKSTIANLRRMRSITSQPHSRLCATMANGERLIVSRQYMNSVKQKLGVK